MPKVSIIISVYNCEAFLESAILSVINQTFSDFELIIVDDGSTDFSHNIALKWAGIDKRVQVYSRAHFGHTKAWKWAIEEISKGEYIAWVDSDDYIHPLALSKCVEALDNKLLGMVYTHYYEMDKDGNNLKLGYRCHIPYSPVRLLVDLMVYHFRLFKKSVYDKVGGLDETYKFNQDFDLILRFSENSQISVVPTPFYFKRLHLNSVTSLYRQEQVAYSKLAIESALKRRGLSDRSVLFVDPHSGQVQLTFNKNK